MGYGIYALTDTTDSVKNYLEKYEFEIIEEDNDTFWTKVAETYKLEKTPESAINSSNTVDANDIKVWCIENLKKNIKSNQDAIFLKASKWCVNYQTIEEVMGDTFETDPTNLANKYDGLDDDVKELISEIVVTSEQKVDGAKIKEWCDTNKKRRSSEDEESFESKLTEICMKVSIGI